MFIHTVEEDFDPEQYFDEVPLYQSLFFRQWQKRFGRNVVALVADNADGKTQAFAQCVEYVLPIVGSVWVAAQGPIGNFSSVSAEEEFYKELRALCHETAPKTSHIRTQRSPQSRNIRIFQAEQSEGSFMQPHAEQVVSLEDDIETVVGRFSKNTRREIRRYKEDQKSDIQIYTEKNNIQDALKSIYTILNTSSNQKKIALHPYTYYETMFDEIAKNPNRGSLVIGSMGEHKKIIGFALTVYTGSEAYYLLAGASSEGYKNAVPTLILSHSIEEAKSRNMARYNLGGVASDTSATLEKLSVFKGKFGGVKIIHDKQCDFVTSVWRYALFRWLRLPYVLVARRALTRLYRKVKVDIEES